MYQLTRRAWLGALAATGLRAEAGTRLDCQTRSYGEPPRTLADLLPLIEDIAAAGYQGFETNQVFLQSVADQAKAAVEIKKRLPLIGLHLGVQLHRPERLEADRAAIDRVSRSVEEFGGDLLVLSGGITGLEGAGLEAAMQRKADELARAGRICRERNVRLCVHNHLDEARNDFAQFRHIVDHTPPEDVRLLLDIAHATNAGADSASFVRQHGSRIAGFHVRDVVGEKLVPMGTGKVDLAGWAKAVRDTRWKGWVIVELDGHPEPGEKPAERVRDARKYLQKLLPA